MTNDKIQMFLTRNRKQFREQDYSYIRSKLAELPDSAYPLLLEIKFRKFGWTILWILCLILTAFIGYLGVGGFIFSFIDGDGEEPLLVLGFASAGLGIIGIFVTCLCLFIKKMPSPKMHNLKKFDKFLTTARTLGY